ncbi:MAG: P1 family peptidase [Hyphomicrobiales bacterium]|nr:P1 family peptidase [Hyphomicrobiales bacterium]
MLHGPTNSLCDVVGLLVGNAEDARVRTGTTVVLGERPFAASVHVMGGAPGTRETDLLAPEQMAAEVDAIVLSGGSAFGLDAASGVQSFLAAQGRGFQLGPARIPLVPAAILFDLLNGGEKAWGDTPPYRDLGKTACEAAASHVPLGAVGAAYGATTASGPGGLGSASAVLDNGTTIGAIAAVNALGSAKIGASGHFWAAPFEIDGEFGGHGLPLHLPPDAAHIRTKLSSPPPGAATTLGVVATDAKLTKTELKRLAIMAHDGFARALWPAHTPFDGDIIFAVSTGARDVDDVNAALIEIGAAAAAATARAIARGVYEAERAPPRFG